MSKTEKTVSIGDAFMKGGIKLVVTAVRGSMVTVIVKGGVVFNCTAAPRLKLYSLFNSIILILAIQIK